MRTNDNKERNKINRHYRRVKERHFWAHFGFISGVSGFVIILLATGLIFFGIVTYSLISIGLVALFFGGFSVVLFGRLGWSESILIDFVLNRLSIISIIVGLILVWLELNSTYLSNQSCYMIFFIAGIILALLGMLFQSPVPDDPRIIKD